MAENNGTVVVTTHDLETAGVLREAFREEGYRVELITPGEDLAPVQDVALLFLSGDVTSESARRLAREARKELHVPVFAVARADDEGARVSARELQVRELFSHPLDVREVVLLGRTLIQRLRLQEITGIVGETDPIREALERVVQIAPVDATVLVTGESGTGKELVARGIHALSLRRHRSFLAVNVAALTDTLLESELFGHEKGAFTGAIDSRRGLFELAQGGTIFLDEIGEMPLSTQTKLLRVLEEREFFRVGGEKPIRVDVRVIAATNQELRRLVEVGDFRRDLYFRINVLHIELPPLRERTADIPLLVDEFIRDASSRHDKPFLGISEEAMEILKAHAWPGNVRELRNLVESMVVLAPGRRIEAADIPSEVRSPGRHSLLPAPLPPAGLPVAKEDGGSLRPELEFVFRTLVNLRMDIDDLRRDFERYKEDVDVPPRGIELVHPPSPPPMSEGIAGQKGEGFEIDAGPPAGGPMEPPEPPDDRVVVFRAGMTMDDVEEEAIRAALEEVGGNRRKAAERLGIGERTLYRKIKKYGMDKDPPTEE